MFGVEAISPAPEGEPNFLAHIACAERGITHMECLANLDKLVGRQKMPVVRMPATKMPSKVESRSRSARYMVVGGGRSSMAQARSTLNV